jgi:hypothetical protein
MVCRSWVASASLPSRLASCAGTASDTNTADGSVAVAICVACMSLECWVIAPSTVGMLVAVHLTSARLSGAHTLCAWQARWLLCNPPGCVSSEVGHCNEARMFELVGVASDL